MGLRPAHPSPPPGHNDNSAEPKSSHTVWVLSVLFPAGLPRTRQHAQPRGSVNIYGVEQVP